MIIGKDKNHGWSLRYLILNPTNATDDERAEFLYRLEQAGFENPAYSYHCTSEPGMFTGTSEMYLPKYYGPHTIMLDYLVENEDLLKNGAEQAAKEYRRQLCEINKVDTVFILTSLKSLEISDSRFFRNIIIQTIDALKTLNINEIGKLTIL